ncbi:caspase family protein [Kitasatospora sp. NPDC057936]|uniref:caspase, EACC1-associated type n=1 Tax=Kitasatospora sp. NPDC057936 TaxID=3346283 RepID=UPI0036D81B95
MAQTAMPKVGPPAGSHALLIGVPDYEHPEFPPVPAARTSLLAMGDLLRDGALCGWEDHQVTVIDNASSADELAIRVADVAEKATGILLLYYVGHGMLSPSGELCLVMPGTRPDRPTITGLVWAHLAEALRLSPAKARITILDCCFAGRAIEALAADGQALADLADIQGVYALTATTRNRTAHVPPLDEQGTRPTSFTGQLCELVRSGIPGKPDQLTLNDIYPVLRARLQARGLPVPNQRGTDTAGQVVFARNAAPAPARAEPAFEGRGSAQSAAAPGSGRRPRPPQRRGGIRRRAFIAGALVCAGAGTATGIALWSRGEDPFGTRRITSADTEDVAFSPDGRTLVTLEDYGQVRDVATGKTVARLPNDQGPPRFLAFSPDGKTFATSSGDSIKVRDAATAVAIATLPAALDHDVVPVAFSPDGKVLACGGAYSGSTDDSAGTGAMKDGFRLLDISTGRVLATSAEHDVRAVAFSPDGRTVACTNDAGCRLWDVASQRWGPAVRGDFMRAVLFTPDGRLVTGDRGGVRLWDAATLRVTATLPPAGTGDTYAVALTRDGRTLAVGGVGGVQVWDLATGRSVATLTSNTTQSLAWSPDGGTLVGATSKQSVKITSEGYPHDSGCVLWQLPSRLLPTVSGTPR